MRSQSRQRIAEKTVPATSEVQTYAREGEPLRKLKQRQIGPVAAGR